MEQAAKADVRQLDLTPQHFEPNSAGYFFFPYLGRSWEKIFSAMVSGHKDDSSRLDPSLLGLKLYGPPGIVTS
jgi:hypothetical protein